MAAVATMPSPRLSDTGSSVNNRSDTSAAHADEWYMRSLLGSQAESRHETAPRYGFGTGQRAAYDIMYAPDVAPHVVEVALHPLGAFA
eukprot:scaffold24483_cov53-Phaeocystis_antarctica.AAC.3